MAAQRTPTAERLSAIGVTVFGLLLAVFPLALWVAWTPFVFSVIFAVGLASAALLLVLLARQRDPAEHPHATSRTGESRTAMADDLVEEIHGIFPLTYHHSRNGRAPYRRTMEKLRRLVW